MRCSAFGENCLGPTGDDECIALEFGDDVVALDGTQVERERHVLNEQHQRGEAAGTATERISCANRLSEHRLWIQLGAETPLSLIRCRRRIARVESHPRTDSIHFASPSFLRIDATCASTVLVGPYQSGLPDLVEDVRATAYCPGSSRGKLRSELLAVRATSSSPRYTRCAPVDHQRADLLLATDLVGGGGSRAGRAARHRRIRAISSLMPNGFARSSAPSSSPTTLSTSSPRA